jgi:glycosyltransferase involved in cell wall biosynthesis
MDLLILPSRAEGLPNVILEAFAYGKPVVATGVGGIPELVENEKNGFLVPPANPDLLAKAIARCVGSPDMLHAMGTAGREKVIAEFTFEQQNTKLQAIYDCLLAGRN